MRWKEKCPLSWLHFLSSLSIKGIFEKYSKHTQSLPCINSFIWKYNKTLYWKRTGRGRNWKMHYQGKWGLMLDWFVSLLMITSLWLIQCSMASTKDTNRGQVLCFYSDRQSFNPNRKRNVFKKDLQLYNFIQVSIWIPLRNKKGTCFAKKKIKNKIKMIIKKFTHSNTFKFKYTVLEKLI